MATKKKLLQAAAGNAGGAGLDVDDVFSTYLYSGNSTARNISNGIDLSGEGGLVWTKLRGPNTSTRHVLIDTERGVEKYLESNTGDAEDTQSGNSLTAFNNNGYTIGNWGSMNASSQDYASWTFRKAPKFFDVVTWSGNSVSGREIPHNLGCAVGAMIIKRTNDSKYWFVYHRSTQATHFLRLNENFAAQDSPVGLGDVEPTSTVFTVSGDELVNQTGGTYVAYLFAHNDGDGEFGPDGNADIVKCGSFTTDSSGFVPEVDLGFEPSWVLIKQTNADNNWYIIDTLRDWSYSSTVYLRANESGAEQTWSQPYLGSPTPTGFKGNLSSGVNNGTFIYIAIRRGPLAPPESATDVFATAFDAGATDPTYVSGFVADMGIQTNTGGYNKRVSSRLTSGRFLEADNTGAEGSSTSNYTWDFMDGWNNQTINSTWLSWVWKRAPNFCDILAYTGNGTAGRTVSHNLGVAPEMVWYKNRSDTINWIVYHKDIGTDPTTEVLELDTSDAKRTSTAFFNSTAPSASVLTLGTASHTNYNNNNYIAYLFASLDGISKVGSVTHSGTTNVDCGFSSGARFVLLKRTDASGDWYVWDSERGIVSGNDPYLLLNTTAAQVTNTDYIDPLSSGFTITSSFTGGDYIFYAIA